VRDGHEVAGLDNFDPFYDRKTKESNLREVNESDAFRFAEMEICDSGPLWDLMAEFKADVTVHLAALAGVQPSLAAPHRFQKVNVEGTLNILEGCRKAGCSRLVFASSSSVYGARSRVPFDETDPVDCPVSPYAATKRCGELICYTYHHLYSIATTCLRFFTVYGPRQRPEMAIAKFTRLVDSGQTVTLYGDGSSGRDYTYVDDVIDGTVAAVERTLSGYRIYNLGNSKPVSLVQLLETIERAVGKTANRVYESDRPGDVPITCARIDRAAEDLDYAPKVPLKEGVARYIEWLRTGSSRAP
jgi:UDP-glucuronate 4-epimerase